MEQTKVQRLSEISPQRAQDVLAEIALSDDERQSALPFHLQILGYIAADDELERSNRLQTTQDNIRTKLLENAAFDAIARAEQRPGDLKRNAERGRLFHRHWAARERVEVEAENAGYIEDQLLPGQATLMVSPQLAEGSKQDIKDEHLADDSLQLFYRNASGQLYSEAVLMNPQGKDFWISYINGSELFTTDDLEPGASTMDIMRACVGNGFSIDEIPDLMRSVLADIRDSTSEPRVIGEINDKLAFDSRLNNDDYEALDHLVQMYQTEAGALALSLVNQELNLATEKWLTTDVREDPDIGGLLSQWQVDSSAKSLARLIEGLDARVLTRHYETLLATGWRTSNVKEDSATLKHLQTFAREAISRDHQAMILAGGMGGFTNQAHVEIARHVEADLGRGCSGSTMSIQLPAGMIPGSTEAQRWLEENGHISKGFEVKCYGHCVACDEESKGSIVALGACGICEGCENADNRGELETRIAVMAALYDTLETQLTFYEFIMSLWDLSDKARANREQKVNESKESYALAI